jgi:catalase
MELRYPDTLRKSHLLAEKKRIWVKFHIRSQQGIENLTDEAAAVVANDRA